MIDYKDILNKYYVLHLSAREIESTCKMSKSGVLKFIHSFEKCDEISFPLPSGITNEAIYAKVYGRQINERGRDLSYELPNFAEIYKLINERKNMTLQSCWNRYNKRCSDEGKKSYQYRQFCDLFNNWCEQNSETLHFTTKKAQTMQVDFAGKIFSLFDKITGEISPIVVFVAVLPYSQYIYAEGMASTKEAHWIEVNNNALRYFGGVPPIIICDNCKQAVITNKDWIDPEINQNYYEWAEHNKTVIMPAKVRKPKYKSSVENAVGILEKGIFQELQDIKFFTLEDFNNELWKRLKKLNEAPFQKREYNRLYYWEEEKQDLLPLPATEYNYMERCTAKVANDFHVRFDNSYYSVDKQYMLKTVVIRATTSIVKIFNLDGELIAEWPRSKRKGEWKTNTKHLPENYKNYAEWSGSYFIQKASIIGENTVKEIKAVLNSKPIEIQTYRLCHGILNFSKKYSNVSLEECCKRALLSEHANYNYIKNTIAGIAEEIGENGFNNERNKSLNNDAYIMDDSYSDMEKILEKSKNLAEKNKEEKQ